MEASGIDAIVTWAPVSVRYLTGYWCWIAPLLKQYMVGPGGGGGPAMRNIAVLPRGNDPTLVVEMLWALNTVGAGVMDIRVVGDAALRMADGRRELSAELQRVVELITQADRPRDPFEALVATLREQGLDGSRIGVELEGAQPADVDELRARLPRAELRDCTNLLRVVRAVKTAEEIGRLERAAEIAEAAARRALGAARDGTSTAEVTQQFRELIARDGADFDHFAFGPSGLGLLNEGVVELREGDTLYADFGVVHDGWFSDSGTTLSIAEPTPAAATEHAAVRDSIAAGAAALGPGRKGSTVQAAMQDALAQEGITESFPHGHGLGLEVRDYPLIMPDSGLTIRDDCIDLASDLELEEGMVVNLEAPLFTPGLRSVHCEQTFVITADGCRALLPQDRSAPVLAMGSGGAL
jgi:Xaa-Pro aminopeptidase